MTTIKTFISNITDEYGGEYKQALVAVRRAYYIPKVSITSENCEDDYIVETELDAITYKVNYWYSEATKVDGKRSRPLLSETENGFTDVFVVDLEHPETEQILASAMEQTDKVLHIIKSDLTRRFINETI